MRTSESPTMCRSRAAFDRVQPGRGVAVVQTFLRKLRHGASLTKADEEALTRLAKPVRRIEEHQDVWEEGAERRSLPLILEGWACRYKLLNNGKRQIVSLFLPGDLCEPFGALPRSTKHALGTLTPVALAPLSVSTVRDAVRSSPRIEEAFWWDLLLASAVERERAVTLGVRSACERIGHLFCELHLRLAMVGSTEGSGYDLPLTQADLGDLLGLSTVHVNRSLQDLRKAGLISLRGRHLTIHDLDGLRDLAMFDGAYLQPAALPQAEPGEGFDRDTRRR